MLRRAAIVTAVAALSVPALGGGASAASWPMTLPASGYCVPAGDDPAATPKAVQALGAPATATKPIAILDRGVDPAAPELAGRVLNGLDTTAAGGNQGDTDGHGTQAAGLAAGAGPGVRGVSPASPILPITAFSADRSSTADSIAKAIGAAVAAGAGVVSIDGYGPEGSTSAADERKVINAIDDAVTHGVLVVAGAGDDSAGPTGPSLPSSFPHVLVAGSASAAATRSSTTNAGPWTDVIVPAEGVIGPSPKAICDFGYGFGTGSSFAVPIYAGAVALFQALRPDLTTQQLFELSRRAATDLGATGRDDDTGFGLLNVTTGLTAQPLSKETLPEVDDDPYWVRGKYAKLHPPLLTKKKLRFKAVGSVSPAKDPADVIPVQLTKRERLVVSVKTADAAGLLELSILGPKAGNFDISDGIDRNRLVSTGGLSAEPDLELTASRSGTYYIAIESDDAVDPDNTTATAPDLVPYTVSAYKQHKKATKAKKKKTK